MKLWVGILFLVVSSQLGINARPIPRSIDKDDYILDDKQDLFGANSLETQSKEQEDQNDHHSEAEHDGDEFESIGHLYRSVRNGRGMNEDDEDTHNDEDVHDEFPFEHSPFHFPLIYTDTTYQEDTAPAHFIPDNKRADDDIMDDKPDAGNKNLLETQSKGQGEHRETEHDEHKLESIGHHKSAREAQVMLGDDEDVDDEFPFEHSPFHFRPTYTDTTYQKDTAPEHFFPSRAKHRGTDNKRADDDIVDNKADADNANLLETQSKEQGDNIFNHGKTEHDGDGSESLGHNGSVRNRRGVAERDEEVHDDFPLQHSSYREDDKHLVTDNKKVDDDIMGEKPDAGNTNSLETQTEEQEDHRGTEHDGDKLESIGYYHGSAREERGMVVDDEDVHDEFPFEHSPFHFRPIYTDTTYQEDIAPEHFFPSRAKYRGTDNKKADDDIMDDKPDAGNENLLEAQSKEHLDHSETEHDGDELESIGYYHGSAREARGVVKDGDDVQDDFPFQHFSYNFRPIHTDNAQLEVGSLEHFVPLHEQDHGMEIKKLDTNAGNVGLRRHRRVSRESHENIDHEPETAKEETKTPEGSKNEIYEDGGASFEVIDSFGNSYSDVIGLATRYRATESEVSQEKGAKVSNEDVGALYVENGFPNEGGHVADNRKDLVSHDEDNLKGDPEALEKEGYFQTSGGDREEGRASELDEDDGKYFLGSESDLEETETLDRSEDDEDEFQISGGELEEVEASERDENDKDDLLASGNDFDETKASDWNYNDEDEIETSGADLGETEASEWDKDDGEDFEASGGETETNMNGVSDANGSGHFELVDGVAYSGHASQLGYEEAKGLGKGHISENVEQNE